MNVPHQLMQEDIEDAAELQELHEREWPEGVETGDPLGESRLAIHSARLMLESHRREEAFNQMVYALGELLSSKQDTSKLEHGLQRLMEHVHRRVQRYLYWYITESAGDPMELAKIITFFNPKITYSGPVTPNGTCRITMEF
jgi:hypothetical protein